MKWVYVEEGFAWRTADEKDPSHKYLRERHPHHYAQIPDDLYDRLKQAEETLQTIQGIVKPYIERHGNV